MSAIQTNQPKTQLKQIQEKINQTKKSLVEELPKLVAIFFFVSVFFAFLMEQNLAQLDKQTAFAEPAILAISEVREPEPKHSEENTELIEIKPPNTQLKEELYQQWADRINQFSVEIGSPLKADYGMVFVNVGVKYNIHPYALVAIAFADTTLGKYLSTPYNLGNVGNTDSCPKCTTYQSWEQGIEAIAKTLRNQYLKNATKLCHLSPGGWQFCPEGRTINNGRVYATSPTNWNRNAVWAESWLHGTPWTTDRTYILTDYLTTD